MLPGLKSMCDGAVVRSTIAGLKRMGKRLYKGSIYGLKRSHRWRVYYWIFFGKCVDFSCFSLQIRCIFEFRSIDFVRGNLIGGNEHHCFFCNPIGPKRWKGVRHFPAGKQQLNKSKQLWAGREKLTMSSSKKPRLCTEYYRKTKAISSNTRNSNLGKDDFVFNAIRV